MSRYIDADALECDTEWSEYHDGFISYSQMEIDTAPSIDIVRCKECIFADGDDKAEMYCCRFVSFPHWNKGEHFCSYGQKGDENVETD